VPEGIEWLGADEAYRTAKECDWGYAQVFLDHSSVTGGARLSGLDSIASTWATLGGWAADLRSKEPAREIILVVDGKVRSRAVPRVLRPDVTKAIGPPAGVGDLFGFDLTVEWPRDRIIALSDLRIYVVSLDGTTRELATRWHAISSPPEAIPREVAQPGAAGEGAALGSVDVAQVEADVVTSLALPAGVQASSADGLLLEGESSADDTISISDLDPARRSADPHRSMFWKVPKGWSGTLPVTLENCPQWHALHGRQLTLHHGIGTVLRETRLLERAGYRKLEDARATAVP
jgi:hypothetical protein